MLKVAETSDAEFVLRLFIAGGSVNSSQAVKNLQAVCTEYLQGRYTLEVIDIRLNKEIARQEQLVALPLLIKDKPLPARRLIGNMSDKNRVLRGLGIL